MKIIRKIRSPLYRIALMLASVVLIGNFIISHYHKIVNNIDIFCLGYVINVVIAAIILQFIAWRDNKVKE